MGLGIVEIPQHSDCAWREDPKVHAHAVLGRRDSSTCGGHLLEARVRPTLELVLTEPPSYLKREYDTESHLPLISIG